MTDDEDERSEKSPNGGTRGLEQLTPDVSEERPLDALVPGMGAGAESGLDEAHADAPSDVGAVHPRLLEVGLEEGREFTLAVWEGAGATEVVGSLHALIRATLLRRWSRPPSKIEDAESAVGFRVLAFDSLRAGTREGLGDLGFDEEPYDPEEYSERMKAWRNEATAADLQAPARPTSVWYTPFLRHAESERAALDEIVDAMVERLGSEVWGETPGGPSKLFAGELEARFDVEIGMDSSSLREMESRGIPSRNGGIAWVRPIVFQALCDYVGVVLHGVHDRRVQWGMCEPQGRGMTPPPMFRVPGSGETIPIGRALLDWCVLPPEAHNGGSGLVELVDHLAASFPG